MSQTEKNIRYVRMYDNLRDELEKHNPPLILKLGPDLQNIPETPSKKEVFKDWMLREFTTIECAIADLSTGMINLVNFINAKKEKTSKEGKTNDIRVKKSRKKKGKAKTRSLRPIR